MRHRKKMEDYSSDLVFCRLDGTPIKRFDKAWREACKIAGFNGLHFHDLRHTFCSNLLLSGVDLKDVKEMIGHRDLSMTDRYSHLNISRKLLSQEKLARFYDSDNGFSGPSGEHIGNTERKIGFIQ
jgi:site-specific recombinase XerD